MSLISWTENGDLVITLRDDGTNRKVSTFLVEVTNVDGVPAQFILPSAKNWVESILVSYLPEENEILRIEISVKNPIPPSSYMVTTFYTYTTDSTGRITHLAIPYVTRLISPDRLPELEKLRASGEVPVELGKNVSVSISEEQPVTDTGGTAAPPPDEDIVVEITETTEK